MLSMLSAGVFSPFLYFSYKTVKGVDSRLLGFISKRNRILSGMLRHQSSRLRSADMLVSRLQADNSKLTSERKDLMVRVDDAIRRVDFLDDFFSQFFSSLDFEVVMALIDSYPGTLNTKELSRTVDVSREKAYEAASRLFKQKWLTKTKTKGFPRTCVWGLKHDKFDLLARIID
jgi:hypothetical protein